MKEPFALELYREYKSGKSISAIAEENGIPEERVRQRIRAAEAYFARTYGTPPHPQAA
jgi:hypothetical protein